MFLLILAIAFFILAFIAACKMETVLKGFLFMVALAGVAGVFYLFIEYPGLSGLAVAMMLGAFIFRQSKK